MSKLRNISKRLVVFLLMFSFLVGILPLNFNTEKVYAKKNKSKAAFYLIVADDYDTFKDLGVTDSSKAKIAVVNSTDFFYIQPPLTTTDKGKKIDSLLASVSHAEIVYIPSAKNWTNSTSKKSDDSAKKWGKQKGKLAESLMKTYKGISKSDKYVALMQNKKIIGIPGSETATAATMNSYISKMNDSMTSYLKSSSKKNKAVSTNTLTISSGMNSDFSEQKEALVKVLKSKDSDAFKYLTSDAKKVDANGSNLNDDSNSGDSKSGDGAQYQKTEDMLKAIGVDAKYKDKVETYATYLTGLQYSDAATAGILANIATESGFNPLSGNSENGGLFGFTPMTNFSNSKFNKDCTHTKGTAGGQSVCSDGKCQIYYVLDCLKGAIDSRANRISKANKFFSQHKPSEFSYGAVAQKSWGSATKVTWPDKIETVKNLDEYKKMTDPVSASGVFMICYEVCAGTSVPCGLRSIDEGNAMTDAGDKSFIDMMLREWDMTPKDSRLGRAKPIYEWLTGKEFANNGNTGNAEQMAEEAQKKGYLTEEELSAWTKIVNEKFINYKGVTRNSLTQSELSSLSRWEKNVKYDDLENHGVFHIFRWLFMVAAIIMMIWSVLLYCAYWLDKVNPFCLPFSFVSLLTAGRLETAPTEEECNFTTRGLFQEKGTKSKFINHKYMLFVCLSLIFFSVLILTGTLYKIILSVIGFVARIFGF